ncbi:MAG: TetR/AcrR family transcriptional regulator [Gaiellales bacterium]
MPRASVETLRRSEIVDGAIRLIARKGYEATTMRGLAAELEVSTGTITHWFATKNQVLGATLEELAVRFSDRVDVALTTATTPSERLIALGDVSVPDTPERADEERVWIELGARAARTPVLAERHERLYNGWRDRMEQAVRDGIAAGVFADVDAPAWARTYAALIDGLATHVLIHPESVTPERMRAALRSHIVATLG